MNFVPGEEANTLCCSQCGLIFPHWEGDNCPKCGGTPGKPPMVYNSEIEWLAARKRRGGLQ